MQKTTIVLTDDLTGESADETVSFGLDGRHYEIDLTHPGAAKLRFTMAQFIDAARKLNNRTPARIGTKRALAKPDTKAYRDTVRSWARTHDVPFTTTQGDIRYVGERGRVADEVFDKYERRNKQTGAPHEADLRASPAVTPPEIVHTTTSTPTKRPNSTTRRKAPAKLTRR